MAKINGRLLEKIEKNPQAFLNLIVRVQGEPEEHLAYFSAKGLEIKRVIHLIPALAISGQAGHCLPLLDEPWVLSLEEDRPVKTLRR